MTQDTLTTTSPPQEPAEADESEALSVFTKPGKLKITLISLHGLIRHADPELGRHADAGGQVKYVLEWARERAAQPNVREVE